MQTNDDQSVGMRLLKKGQRGIIHAIFSLIGSFRKQKRLFYSHGK